MYFILVAFLFISLFIDILSFGCRIGSVGYCALFDSTQIEYVDSNQNNHFTAVTKNRRVSSK